MKKYIALFLTLCTIAQPLLHDEKQPSSASSQPDRLSNHAIDSLASSLASGFPQYKEELIKKLIIIQCRMHPEATYKEVKYNIRNLLNLSLMKYHKNDDQPPTDSQLLQSFEIIQNQPLSNLEQLLQSFEIIQNQEQSPEQPFDGNYGGSDQSANPGPDNDSGTESDTEAEISNADEPGTQNQPQIDAPPHVENPDSSTQTNRGTNRPKTPQPTGSQNGTNQVQEGHQEEAPGPDIDPKDINEQELYQSTGDKNSDQGNPDAAPPKDNSAIDEALLLSQINQATGLGKFAEAMQSVLRSYPKLEDAPADIQNAIDKKSIELAEQLRQSLIHGLKWAGGIGAAVAIVTGIVYLVKRYTAEPQDQSPEQAKLQKLSR